MGEALRNLPKQPRSQASTAQRIIFRLLIQPVKNVHRSLSDLNIALPRFGDKLKLRQRSQQLKGSTG